MWRAALLPTVLLAAGSAWALSPAAPPPRPEGFRDCKNCPDMIPLTGGAFLMGSPPGEASRHRDEGPQRRITVGNFAIGRYPVTRAEYAAFARETGRRGEGCGFYDGQGMVIRRDHSWSDPGFPQASDHPVVCVTPADAEAYAAWLSARTGREYRLPSEAEWEYAARAGETGARTWVGQEDSQCLQANGADRSLQAALPNQAGAPCDDGFPFTGPVGRYAPNRFGLHDMIGNAWQWTAGCYTPSLGDLPADGSPAMGPAGCQRVARGGSWGTTFGALRLAIRYQQDHDHRNYNFGFRIARSMDRVVASAGQGSAEVR